MMDFITNKPHLIIWASLPLLMLTAYLAEDRSNIMIPMVILLSAGVALFLLLTGIGYWIVLNFNGQLMAKLTQIHVIVSISVPIILCIVTRLLSAESSFAQVLVGTLVVILLGSQLLFFYNFIVGLRSMGQ